MPRVRVSYYSDVLCVWAYIAHRRLEELVQTFGDQLEIDMHFCSVFPDAWEKIETNWADKGGFEGFNRHLQDVGKKFPHIKLHEQLWLDAKPRTSASAHIFLKAIEMLDAEANKKTDGYVPILKGNAFRATWEVRRAFFEHALDISDWQVHRQIANTLKLDYDAIDAKIRSSEAVARLAADYNLSQKNAVDVSPTFIMNEGRQRLAGNVGYRLLEANVQELLRNPLQNEASWC